jgi:hypothetical protein
MSPTIFKKPVTMLNIGILTDAPQNSAFSNESLSLETFEFFQLFDDQIVDTLCKVGIKPDVAIPCLLSSPNYSLPSSRCPMLERKHKGKGFARVFANNGRPTLYAFNHKHGGIEATFTPTNQQIKEARARHCGAPISAKRTPARPIVVPVQTVSDHDQRKKEWIEAAIKGYPDLVRITPETTEFNAHYLRKKNLLGIVERCDIRFMGDGIAYAMSDISGKIIGIKQITPDGFKKAVTGSSIGIMRIEGTGHVVVFGEGFATVASVCEVSGHSGIVCDSTNGLSKFTEQLAKAGQLKTKDVLLTIDNDFDPQKPSKGNPGLFAALNAAKTIRFTASRVRMYMPEGGQLNDASDVFLLNGHEALRKGIDKAPELAAFVAKRLAEIQDNPKYKGKRKLNNSELGIGIDLLRLHSAHEIQIKNVAREAMFTMVRIGSMSKKAIIDAVMAFSRGYIKQDNALNLYKKAYAYLKKQAAGLIRPTKEGLSSVTEHIRVQNIVEASYVVDRMMTKHAETGAIIMLNAPMGAGKTQHIMAPQFKRLAQYGFLPMAILPLVSLALQTCERTDGFYYEDLSRFPGIDLDHKGLVTCLHSLQTKEAVRDNLARSHALFLDEINQLLHITTTSNHIGQRSDLYRLLGNAIHNSQFVFAADAHLNDLSIQYLAENTGGKPIIFIDSERSKENRKIVNISSTEAGLLKAEALLNAGKNVMVPTDSKNMAEKVYQRFSQILNPDEILLVHAENDAGVEQQRFLANPNLTVSQYKAVIYTPKLQSGFSIETGEFEVVCFLSGQSLSVPGALQLSQRYRLAKEITICLEPYHGWNEDNAEAICKGYLKMFRELTRYDHMNAKVEAFAAQNKNSFAALFPLVAEIDGFEVRYDASISEEETKAVRKSLAHIKQELNEKKDTDIKVSRHINQDEARIIERKPKTAEDAAALEKFKIKEALGVEEVTQADLDFKRKFGLAAVERHQTAVIGRDICLDVDGYEERDNIPLCERHHYGDQNLAYQIIFKHIGFDKCTGEGQWTKKEAKAAIDELLDTFSRERLNVLKIGTAIRPTGIKDNVKWIGGVLKRIGLMTKGKTARCGSSALNTNTVATPTTGYETVYSVDSESFNAVRRYFKVWN